MNGKFNNINAPISDRSYDKITDQMEARIQNVGCL